MKRIRLLVAVLPLLLFVVVRAGGTSQTQGPGGSDPLSLPSGTAPTGQEETRALPEGRARLDEAEADLAPSYNATVRIPVAALKPRDSDVDWHAGGGGGLYLRQ